MKAPIPATIASVKTHPSSPNAIRLTVDTQETLTDAQFAELFRLQKSLGYFFFLDKPEAKIKTDDLPDIHLDDGEKSPSQRLRAVLYIWWQQHGSKDDFELFYRRWMERTIDKVKEQLT